MDILEDEIFIGNTNDAIDYLQKLIRQNGEIKTTGMDKDFVCKKVEVKENG